MIEILRKSFLEVLVKYTLRIEVWLWKVLLSQHFQFKRFQDEKMKSTHFPLADVWKIAQKINLNKDVLYWKKKW